MAFLAISNIFHRPTVKPPYKRCLYKKPLKFVDNISTTIVLSNAYRLMWSPVLNVGCQCCGKRYLFRGFEFCLGFL